MPSSSDHLDVPDDDQKFRRSLDGGRDSESQLVNCFATPPRSRASSVTSFLSNVDLKPRQSHLPQPVLDLLNAKQLDVDEHSIVSWRQDSISLPRNWISKQKIYYTAGICLAHFASSMFGNTGSTVANYAKEDLEISQTLSVFSFVTMYWIGQALGSFIFPPVSEVFGDKRLFSWAAACFGTTCLIVATGPNLWSVLLGRSLSGMVAAVPSVVALGTFEHLWNAKGRIWVVSVWAVSGVLGFALGPVMGSHVSETGAGWEWVYYGGLIANVVIGVFCFLMTETQPNLLLHQEVRQIEKATGFGGLRLDESHRIPSYAEFAQHQLLLPLKLSTTEPLILLSTLLAAFSFGLTTLFTETIPIVYTSQFDLSPQTSSLTFLALALGAILFSWLPRLYDIHRHHTFRPIRSSTSPNPTAPEAEKKLWSYSFIASPIFVLALWWFSFTVPNPVFGSSNPSAWLSIVPLLLIGYCLVEFSSILPLYLTEVYSHHTASAYAPLHAIRALLAGIFPLFAAKEFDALGPHRAVWVLAGITTGFCGLAVATRFMAKTVREKSKFAKKMAEEREKAMWKGNLEVVVETEVDVVRTRSVV
ncbi:hypothetical protein CKM354_001145600 [Cercospora kikuchii]|uniref:Major facilitator superfamily (MFS) profile domain-containing protein n=1 Tax=Cercospora kikuchii TaxID=84275 RepID=A0A9P3CT08_9PEZI|nr:uncharacterized protein CKM354_001145600 [Cercospora kikuchii]GIZ48394.1 hypothetical protein CKM354_001145600 [Cercospora kikuchii]